MFVVLATGSFVPHSHMKKAQASFGAGLADLVGRMPMLVLLTSGFQTAASGGSRSTFARLARHVIAGGTQHQHPTPALTLWTAGVSGHRDRCRVPGRRQTKRTRPTRFAVCGVCVCVCVCVCGVCVCVYMWCVCVCVCVVYFVVRGRACWAGMIIAIAGSVHGHHRSRGGAVDRVRRSHCVVRQVGDVFLPRPRKLWREAWPHRDSLLCCQDPTTKDRQVKD